MAGKIENLLSKYVSLSSGDLTLQPKENQGKLKQAQIQKSLDFIDQFEKLDPAAHDLRGKDLTPIKRTWVDSVLMVFHGIFWICAGIPGVIFDSIVSYFYEDYEYDSGLFSTRLKLSSDETSKSIFTAALFLHAQHLLSQGNLSKENLTKLQGVVDKYRKVFYEDGCSMSISLLQTNALAQEVFKRVISIKEGDEYLRIGFVEDRCVKEETFTQLSEFIQERSNQVSSNVQ